MEDIAEIERPPPYLGLSDGVNKIGEMDARTAVLKILSFHGQYAKVVGYGSSLVTCTPYHTLKGGLQG